MKCIFLKGFTIIITLAFLSTPVRAAGKIYYVKQVASEISDCSSWGRACILQTALTSAANGDQIWAAAGTYKPTTDVNNRDATFQLKEGVAIYGGFAGTETELTGRNPRRYVTILSGDIDNNDDQTPVITNLATESHNTANSYHVVTGANNATLDGFTITAGNASASSSSPNGGGMYISGVSPTLTNIIFSGNSADSVGGGMFNTFARPTLMHVIFSGNSAPYGGGLYNDASKTALTTVTFSGNSASYGGGMYISGAYNDDTGPTMTDIIFSGNSASKNGGGLYNNFYCNWHLTNVTFSGNSANEKGGGMYNDDHSTPYIEYSTFTGNTAGYGIGGGMYNIISDPVLSTVTFSDNTAGQGGGMFNDLSDPYLMDVTFSGNTADQGAGGMYNAMCSPYLFDVTFSGNTAANDPGGGMYNDNSSPFMDRVTFSNNKALNEAGGGMYNNATSSPRLELVTFSGNSAARAGGGMFNTSGSPTLHNVTFSGNTSGYEGGGMYNYGYQSSTTLESVTFNGNTADDGGGGMFNRGPGFLTLTNVTFSGNTSDNGGGLHNMGSGPLLTNVTFSGNSASKGGGGMYNASGLMLTTVVRNTIFWGNTASSPGTAQIDNVDNSNPTVKTSVIQDDCPAGSNCMNIITADPMLGTLGNYNAFTQTIPLLAGSSAIDQGDDTVCPANDQRNVIRPQGAHCDIGAYEKVYIFVARITASDKVYDGTTNATLDTSKAYLFGYDMGDNVTLITSGATGSFDTPDVGDKKTVSVSGLTLAGADAGYYILTQPTLTASITPATTTTSVAPTTTTTSIAPTTTTTSVEPTTTTTIPTTSTTVLTTSTTTPAEVPRTGQTTCYDATGATGNVISCAGTGQDGEIQAGVAWPDPRFTDRGDGTVTDNLTGLVWAKNANLLGTVDADNDTDGTAGDGEVTWQHALDYIKKLNRENYLGHNDWRLPNVNELESLVDFGAYNPALAANPFTNVQSSSTVYVLLKSYWSSSTYTSYTAFAWVVDMLDGNVGGGYKTNIAHYYVWPVCAGQCGSFDNTAICLPRTGQTTCYDATGATGNVISCAGTGQDGDIQAGVAWPDPRFTDRGDGTVSDNLTGLVWAKNANLLNGTGGLLDALNYVAGMNAGTNQNFGYTDWRLPNVNELESLVDFGTYNPALAANPFTNVQSSFYWSSTASALGPSAGWTVNIGDGYVNHITRGGSNSHLYACPVRAGQVNNPVITTTTSVSTTSTSVSTISTSTSTSISSTSTSTSTSTSASSTSTSTTTTSVAPTTSTTTTTTGGGKPCPAKKALGENNPKLENLRYFRDSKLAQNAVGRKAIQIYYNNAESINAALERSPALRTVVRIALEELAPMLGKDGGDK